MSNAASAAHAGHLATALCALHWARRCVRYDNFSGTQDRFPMPIQHKCWHDPIDDADGYRLLICRYRPRALRKEAETWQAWWKVLGPSKELHADYYGKHGLPINWETYRARYLQEMANPEPREKIDELARRIAAGETITLLCSSACTNPDRCHRTLLKTLIEAAAAALSTS
jgi:uncharacterized protein YeaO (DUF488 family)